MSSQGTELCQGLPAPCSHPHPTQPNHQNTASVLLPGEEQPRWPPQQLADPAVFPWRRGRRDAALSQAAATTLKPEGGIRLPRDTADQGQASPGTARSSVLPMSKSGDAQPPRGLGLTLALPWLLPGYPVFFGIEQVTLRPQAHPNI